MRPRVLVAPDSFKGTLTAAQVASAVARGLRERGADVVEQPLADGGEGTVAALRAAWGGTLRHVPVRGPLGDPVDADLLVTADGRAVVETASASGLHLVPPHRRDAVAASTTGTGQLLAAAVATGARAVLLGVGGSATTDGGAGALTALTDAGLPPGLGGCALTVLCDVRTPFERAAEVYGPQKGATPEQVELLTARLHALAASWPRDPRGVPATGAAGGLSGALWAVHGATLAAGAETVLDAVGLDARLASVDLVVTGEGRLDAQTAEGKLVAAVAGRARAAGVPVAAVVGRDALDAASAGALGLTLVVEAGDEASLAAAAPGLLRLL